ALLRTRHAEEVARREDLLRQRTQVLDAMGQESKREERHAERRANHGLPGSLAVPRTDARALRLGISLERGRRGDPGGIAETRFRAGRARGSCRHERGENRGAGSVPDPETTNVHRHSSSFGMRISPISYQSSCRTPGCVRRKELGESVVYALVRCAAMRADRLAPFTIFPPPWRRTRLSLRARNLHRLARG